MNHYDEYKRLHDKATKALEEKDTASYINRLQQIIARFQLRNLGLSVSKLKDE